MVLWYNTSCGEGLDCVHEIRLSQSGGLPNPPARIKVPLFTLQPSSHTGRSWPWQDPMRDPERQSQPVSWPEMAPSPLPPSISTSNRTSTKTTQLGNKNAEGQKEKEKEVEAGEGGSRQITFDPKIVNGSLTGSMLWEVYGLWLSGPVCTKVMRLWKGPWIDSFFLLCVVRARAPRHSYHWAVTARRGVTLWKHTGFHRS